MAHLFKNRYRIKSARFEHWDYRWAGAYFVTICTANRRHCFGEIQQGKMDLTPVGVIADILWHEIPHHASYVQLGNFVAMPNHIHGILILQNPEIPSDVQTLHATSIPPTSTKTPSPIPTQNNADGNDGNGNNGDGNDADGNDANDPVQTLHATSLPSWEQSPNPPPKNIQMAKISPKSNSISTIIRSYKSAVTKHAHRLGYDFEWQTRFHDHIIRNERAFQNISNYILNNPINWKKDKFST